LAAPVSDIPIEVRAAVGAVALEASNLEFTLCRMAAQVMLGCSWSDDDTAIARWMRNTGEPLRRARAAARSLDGVEAERVDAWVQQCGVLLERRHRIVHGVFGYDPFGQLVFGFGRRDTPEVIDVAGLEFLAADLHSAGLDNPVPE
jgi:hypothetical protein